MKNNYQDHREACKKENCASCNFDEGKLGGWDRSHRAGAVLAEFKDKTLQGIVAELGWKTTKTADKRFSIPCKCLLSLTYNRLFSSIYQTHYQYNCLIATHSVSPGSLGQSGEETKHKRCRGIGERKARTNDAIEDQQVDAFDGRRGRATPT